MVRRFRDSFGHVQTWVWTWSAGSASAVAVVMWALINRLPGVIVFVLGLGTGVMMLIGFETALAVHEKIQKLRRARYRRAVAELGGLRSEGGVLRNRAVASDLDVQTFGADLKAFETKALWLMRGAATRTDVGWFRDLPTWKPPVVAGFNYDHARMVAVLDEKLRRIHDVASGIEAKIR